MLKMKKRETRRCPMLNCAHLLSTKVEMHMYTLISDYFNENMNYEQYFIR